MRRTLAALLLVLAAACGSPRPWKVTSENQRRFDQAKAACLKLTDSEATFDKCMKRRGFRREYPGGW